MKTTVTVLLFLNLFGLNSSLYRKHFYVKEYMNWNEAKNYCKQNYGDLSTISSEDLQTLSSNLEITGEYYWIGLKRHGTHWKWSDGKTATNNEWDENQGNTDHEDCGVVSKSVAKLHDFPCDLDLTFYCMADFNVILENKTWEEALDYCRQQNTDLASLSSKNVNVVKNMIQSSQTIYVWTGLRFLAGQWFWVSGDDLKYKANEELQCPTTKRCGALDRHKNVWELKDCEERLNFLCSPLRKVEDEDVYDDNDDDDDDGNEDDDDDDNNDGNEDDDDDDDDGNEDDDDDDNDGNEDDNDDDNDDGNEDDDDDDDNYDGNEDDDDDDNNDGNEDDDDDDDDENEDDDDDDDGNEDDDN
ncbi:acidic leucine-rich nuclear phosphoprotein 32 family member A-like [Myxocyprinus asiaticus]|uniref:acidic leucine-rich nuclear phosphoprotein 32 family member A-like n=1 Tax=Myxocyprinus asiaticus TaxID=70543 RepID=UPI002223C764|nr:acidic leucine-rich nuclear phosphoprotein 32 family member A-like [Myxocyprinus asiaticus]